MNRKNKYEGAGIADVINIDREFTIAVDILSDIIDEEVKYHLRSPMRLVRCMRNKICYIIKLFFTLIFYFLKNIFLNPFTRNLAALVSSIVITLICFLILFIVGYWFLYDILHLCDSLYHYLSDTEYKNKDLVVRLHDKIYEKK